MNKYITYTLTILLIGITLLFSCSSTKKVDSPEPIKTKSILGVFDLDSLSQSKNDVYDSIGQQNLYLPTFNNKSIIINRRHQLLFAVPYRGDNGISNAEFYGKGIWKSSRDTLFLTFGLEDDKNITEEAYIFRADSLISTDTTNHKIWIKRK